MKRVFVSFSFLVLAGILLSCKENFFNEPVSDGKDYSSFYDDFIDPPSGVSATNGEKQKIIVSWNPVSGAVGYDIFYSDNPYGNSWVQCGEEKSGRTEFELQEKPGVKKYFKVKSRNNKTCSLDSSVVSGSTLAVPVVTVEQIENDCSKAIVRWYMNNCTSSTYLNSVRFAVQVYDKDKNPIPNGEILISSGSERSCIVQNLNQSSQYYFTVEAFIEKNQNSGEKSDFVDIETSKNIIPLPPVDFAAEKGESTDKVKLSWILPEFVSIKDNSSSDGNVFEERPLYFEISRRELGSAGDFVTLVSYIGTVESKYKEFDGEKYLIDCSAENSFENLKVIKPAEAGNITTNYAGYVPGTTVEYYDTTGKRGVKYEYAVRSFTDDVSSKITFDSSVKYDAGWKVKSPVFSCTENFETAEDENSIIAMNVDFSVDFDEMELPEKYSYVLKEIYTPFNDTDKKTEAVLLPLDNNSASLENIRQFKKQYLSENGNFGYFYYELCVYSGENLVASAMSNSLTFSSKKDSMPFIEEFSVQDGYKNMFVLSWVYDEKTDYYVGWNSINDDNIGEVQEIKIDVESSDFSTTEKDGKIYAHFIHNAKPGEVRKYFLRAGKTFDKTDIYVEENFPEKCETLGLPEIIFDEIQYDKITFKVMPVQCGKNDFEISLKYKDAADSPEELVNAENLLKENSDSYSLFTVEKPLEFDNPKISGKDMILIVKAKSSKIEGEEIENSITVKLLGPALVELERSETIYDSQIVLQWNKVAGAKKYMIHRGKQELDSKNRWETVSTNTYIYDEVEKKLYLKNDVEINENCAEIVVENGIFTFKDKYLAEGENSKYFESQSQISWGIPFEYVVLPVISEEDFDFEMMNINSENAAVNYSSSLNSVTSASNGYGININAEKAVKGLTQVIEWNVPYFGGTGYVYRKETGESSKWTKIGESSGSCSSFQYNPGESEKTEAFEYLVKYNTLSSDFAESYLNSLKNSFDDESETEQKNKGYLLSLNFSSAYNGTQDGSSYAKDKYYYSERVEWEKWNDSLRNLKPDSYEIFVKNLNLAGSESAAWKSLYKMNGDFEKTNLVEFADTSVEERNSSLILKPVQLTENLVSMKPEEIASKPLMGTTDGILKVLRNNEHQYKIVLTRGSNTAEFETSAKRQVSDEEIAKSVNLIFGTVLSGDEFATVIGKNGGNFSWEKSTQSFTDYVKWTVTDYSHIWVKENVPGGEDTYSFLSLNDQTDTTKGFWNAQKSIKLRVLCSSGKTVSESAMDCVKFAPFNESDKNLESYTGELKFSYSDNQVILKIVRNGVEKTIVSFSNDNEQAKFWVPAKIGDNKSYIGKDVNYDWWEE